MLTGKKTRWHQILFSFRENTMKTSYLYLQLGQLIFRKKKSVTLSLNNHGGEESTNVLEASLDLSINFIYMQNQEKL